MNIKNAVGRVFNVWFWLTSSFFRILFLVVSIVVIINLTYLFGFHILVGTLKGGDAGYAYHNLYWFARWYPEIPVWYPLQGAGFSFTLSYPFIQNIVAVWVKNLFAFDLNQSLRVLTFASYLWGALGVYAFCATRLKNQVIGFVASVLFLIIPGNWFWITKLGYYAYTIAISFIPWGFLTFDLFLTSFFKKTSGLGKAIRLFLAALVLGLAFMFHTFVGVAMALGYLVYGVVAGLLLHKNLISFRGIIKGLSSSVLVLASTFTLFSFWFVPVLNNNYLSSRDGLQAEAGDQLVRWAEVNNPTRLLFDYSEQERTDVFPQPSFPRLLVNLALLSFPLAILLRIKKGFFPDNGQSKVIALAFVGLFFLFWSGLPSQIDRSTLEKFRFVFSFLQYNTISVSAVSFAIIGAFSIYSIFWIVSELLYIPFHIIKVRQVLFIKATKSIIVAILTLYTFGFLLIYYEKGPSGGDSVSYGPPEDPIGDERKDLGFKGLYFKPQNEYVNFIDWPRQLLNSFAYRSSENGGTKPKKVSSVNFGLESTVKGILSNMQADQFTRVGLTGNIGATIQEWSTYTDASTINQFMYKGSFFQSLRGYSETVFFGKDETNHDPVVLSNLAKYLGYEYSVVTPDIEDTSHYLLGEWEEMGKEGAWSIMRFKQSTGIVSITSRPTVLVIVRNPSAFESVFKTSLYGVIPYDKAILVEGASPNVDDYTISTLKKYDAIILYGYNYSNQREVFATLDQYVKEGGKLFIEVGWQYLSKDWQLTKTPAFFPSASIVWDKSIQPKSYQVSSGESLVLEWEGKPWGVSNLVDLRSLAESLLALDGKTIIAGGNWGKGKVIVSGINIFGLASYQKYSSQIIDLSKSIFKEFFDKSYESEQPPSIKISRSSPDRVVMSITGINPNSKLFWREGFSPHWHAEVKTDKSSRTLNLVRAGPGFPLAFLPETSSATVVLEYKLGWVGFWGKLISTLTIVLFLVAIIDTSLLKNTLSGKIINILNLGKDKIKSRYRQTKNSWSDNED